MHSRKIVFITGGARSGKSSFAVKEASGLSGKKAYIATAEALDEEMRERIEKHKKQRGRDWDIHEEPVRVADLIGNIADRYEVITIDCLTLWLSNVMIRAQNTEHRRQTTEAEIERLLDSLRRFKDPSVCGLISGSCSLFLVSNEVGMGIVPQNELAREFRDTVGILNQNIAETADEVYMVVAGIPVRVK